MRTKHLDDLDRILPTLTAQPSLLNPHCSPVNIFLTLEDSSAQRRAATLQTSSAHHQASHSATALHFATQREHLLYFCCPL